jgi:hypothetical protein
MVDQDPSRIKSTAKDGGGAFCVLSGVRGFDFARRAIPNRSNLKKALFISSGSKKIIFIFI